MGRAFPVFMAGIVVLDLELCALAIGVVWRLW